MKILKNVKKCFLLLIFFMLFSVVAFTQEAGASGGANGGGVSGGPGTGSASGGPSNPGPSGGEDSGGKVANPGEGGGENSGTNPGEGGGSDGENDSGNDGEDGADNQDSERTVGSGSEAITHIQNGGNVKTVSTQALREGIEACGDNPDLSDVKSILMNELDSRNKISTLENNALSAEDAYAEAMKEYLAAEFQLKEKEKALNEAGEKMQNSLTTGEMMENMDNWNAACEAYVKEKQKVQEKKEAAEKAKNEAQAAYDSLSIAYNEAGDPVNVGNGQYLLTYTDFEAIDELTHFKVSRNYSFCDYEESFGRNWICSLDSRIIRCRDFDYSEMISIIKEMINIAEDGKAWLIAYNSSYPSSPQEEITQKLNYITEQIKIYKKALKSLKKCQDDAESNDFYNYKVAYGRYKDVGSRFGLDNRIIYVDPQGESHTFTYDSATSSYTGIDFYTKAQISLSLRKNPDFDIFNGKYEGDSEEAKLSLLEDMYDYEMRFSDGSVKYFTIMGVLKSEVDRNGNVTSYETGKSGRIEKINLPTGETITVTRYSNGLIKSIGGDYSGTTKYTYDTNKIADVTFNNHVKVGYEYDYGRHLSKIKKADGNYVSIYYDNDKVSRVIDENGNVESFSYYSGMTEHKTVDGGKETYIINDDGNTVKKTDARGVVYTIETDGWGRPSVESYLGVKKTYSYNGKGLVSSISYSTGGTESFSYNDYGQITKHTDCDGFSRAYNYDNCGNVTEIYYCGNLQSSFTYYYNGLILQLYEKDNVYTYNYNDYGQLISKNWKDKTGQTRIESFSYNSNGKLSYYKDYYGNVTRYYYSDNYIKEVTATKEIEHFYNSRQWETKTIYKDLVSGKTYAKTCVYDGNGNIIKIFFDGKLYGQYEYTSNNQIKSYTIWNNLGNKTYKTLRQGTKTEYIYNNWGNITEEKKSILCDYGNKDDDTILIPINVESKQIKRCNYNIDGKGITVYEYPANMSLANIYKYDSNERLIQRRSPDGYTVNYSYSKAGRLLEISDSDGKKETFKYNSDGTIRLIIQRADNSSCVFDYDVYHRLTKNTDFEGNIFQYYYDSNGNLVTVSKPDSKLTYSYDYKNRLISENVFEKNGKLFYSKKITYNEDKNQKIENICDLQWITYYYDGFDRLIKKSEQNITTEYIYDILGNIEKITNSDGEILDYEYTPNGNISYESFGDDVITYSYDCTENCIGGTKNGYKVFSKFYNNNGSLAKQINQFGEELSYEYGATGKITEISKSDTGRQKITSSKYNFSFTSENNTEYLYKLNDVGLIESESVNNKTREYQYDKNGRINYKKDFSGKTQSYFYDIPKRNTIVNFSDGEKYSISTDLNGQITQLATNNYKLNYDYNLWGKIEKSDNSIFECPVYYVYDSYGRCVGKKSKYFDFVYSYGKNNLINKISEEKSGFEVKLEYDNKKREIKRIFSTGIEISTGYSKNNKTWIVAKNNQNLIQFANFILYDECGRVNCVCNEKGDLTKYNYDEKGRLISVYSPYTSEICEFAYNEAVECGLFIKNEKPDGDRLKLTEDEISELNKIITAAGLNNKVSIQQSNYMWKEEFEYTKTGSVAAVKNPFGKIYYEYNSENRIIKKWAGHNSSSVSNGMEISWDADGNLIKVKSGFRDIRLEYNENNKPKYILNCEKNEKSGQSVYITEFIYDPLGRICKEIVNGSQCYEYIYDGTKNQVLCKIPVTENEIGVSKYAALLNEISKGDNFSEKEKNVIHSNETIVYEEVPQTRDFSTESYSTAISSKAFIPEVVINPVIKSQDSYLSNSDFVFDKRSRCYLYLFGVPVYCLYEDENTLNGYDSEYYIYNFQNQIVQICNENSIPKFVNSYDNWGNSLNGGKDLFYSNGFNYGRGNLCLYNLGNRFYFPLLKTFISEDPAKDGGNYYTYCATDPVNYCDYSGNEKKGSSKGQNAAYAREILNYGSFNGDNQKKNGSDMGIPYSYDCADSSTAVDTQCSKNAGINNYSDMATNFDNRYDPNSPDGQKNSGSKKSEDNPQNYSYSALFWNEGMGDNENVILTSTDPSALRDPSIVTPGTILVIAPNANNPNVPDGNKTGYGHTITVIARDFDANGNIVGLIILENHVASQGNVSYMVIEGVTNISLDQWRYDAWRGEYVGTFEIEGKSHADMNNRRNCGL